MQRKIPPAERLPVPVETIERRIYLIRGQKVMLDSDLADLYQVPTKALNQAVHRNLDRFPQDFMFRLAPEENDAFNRSQVVTGSQKHRDPRYLPYAFTELGVAMLSSVLNSQRAVQMNILIMRAFVKLRELLATNKALAERIEKLERASKEHGAILVAVVQDIQKLKHPPTTRAIGFITRLLPKKNKLPLRLQFATSNLPRGSASPLLPTAIPPVLATTSRSLTMCTLSCDGPWH